jgi:ABC-type polysaccharide/polyol phosphate transport system ATPase subunit
MAAHLKPVALLVNEVLILVNAAFQNKCLGKICSKGFYGYS